MAGRTLADRCRPVWRSGVARVFMLASLMFPHTWVMAAPSPAAAASAGSERALERRVKAAFLFRFTEFVNWPESAFARPDSSFTIAVAGRGGFADELRQVTGGRSVVGRPVEVRRVSEGENMPAAHILLVPDAEKQRLREWVRIAPRNALIVTESAGALTHGSVINFVIVEGRVRFEISLQAAEKRGLRMSSRLLALALIVRAGNP